VVPFIVEQTMSFIRSIYTVFFGLLALASCTEKGQSSPCANPVIVFALGDSLTDGFSLGTRNAYPKFLEEIALQQGYCIQTHNGGRSGDTTTDALGRLSRYSNLKWDFAIVALGINDVFRGLEPEAIAKNLQTIVLRLRQDNPDGKIILAGMQVPAAFNLENAGEFKLLYPQVAQELGLLSIPFLLDGVLDDPELNLPDRLHPNRAGHQRMAQNAWQVIKELVEAPNEK